MRRAAKIDSNQNEVVKALRQIPGVSVAITSSLGKGYPDLNIGYKGKTYLIELKDGAKRPSEKKLSPDEVEFQKKWYGHYAVCESVDQILQVLNINQ